MEVGLTSLVFGFIAGGAGNVIASKYLGNIVLEAEVTTGLATAKATKPSTWDNFSKGAASSLDTTLSFLDNIPIIGDVTGLVGTLDGTTLEAMLDPVPGLLAAGVLQVMIVFKLPNWTQLFGSVGVGVAYWALGQVSEL